MKSAADDATVSQAAVLSPLTTKLRPRIARATAKSCRICSLRICWVRKSETPIRASINTETALSTSSSSACIWNGRAWSVVDTPGAGTLWAMSAVSASDIWAVGNNGPQTLTMHWDGKTWSVIPSPNPGPGGNSLNGVAAVASRDVWAVGTQNPGGGDRTLAMHWDGARWEIAPSPGANSYLDTLSTVAAAGDTVWAAGSSITDAVGTNKTLVERYNDPCQ